MTKTRVILLNFLPDTDSSYKYKGTTYPSTAILLIGTLLKENGFEVEIIDGAFYEDYLKRLEESIKKGDVLFVGMSVMSSQVKFALEASKIVRKLDETTPVIWGGPHATLFPKQVISNENIDIAVINEGAITTLELAKTIKNGGDLNSIKGIGFKNGDKIGITQPSELEDIRELPFFNFSITNIENYLNPEFSSVYQREFPNFKEKIKVMPMLTGLGCPYRCQFCINVILGRKYRYRSAKSIVDEIKRLINEYGTNTFLFLDENFFANKKKVMEFITLVEEEGLHFNWRFWCRVDYFNEKYINEKLLKRLGSIGHGSMVMGAESANIETLLRLKKGIKPEQIIQSLKYISKISNIFPRYSFIVGLEDESVEDIKNTYRMCLELKKINPQVDIAGPFIFRMYPGSPIYNRIVEKYNLHIPTNLYEWVEYYLHERNYSIMDWTPRWFQKNSKYLVFYSHHALRSSGDRFPGLSGMLYPVFQKFSRFRMRYFFFYIPLEYLFLVKIKKLINKINI